GRSRLINLHTGRHDMLTFHHAGCHRALLERTAAPTTEPLGLTEAKLFLRVDGTEEDDLISSLITATREQAEEYLRRSLITQNWSLWLDEQVSGHLWLPMGPVQSIGAVQLHTR